MSNEPTNYKTIYEQARRETGMSRAKVEDISSTNYNSRLTESILEKIESGKQYAQPCHVNEMSEIYNKPELCYYYCSNECDIGINNLPPIIDTIHDLPQLTVQLLSKLNSLQRDKDRIIDIIADGQISEDEKHDFEAFKTHLEEMSLTINALQLWIKRDSRLQELFPSSK